LTAKVLFRSVEVRAFRNLKHALFEPAPRLNVIAGDNGQGKTSLLEALYFVAVTKSFRTERLQNVIQEGEALASVRAEIRDEPYLREQRVTQGARSRSVLLDGKKPERLGVYATRTPVVVFHPGDLELVSGGAQGRRKLLDRIALFLDATSGDTRLRYTEALRGRQTALQERGVSAPDLDAYESVMADYGARFARARAEAAALLTEHLRPAFERMATPGLTLDIEFKPGGSEDVDVFRRELAGRRLRDVHRPTPSFGPQRDEIEFRVAGRTARHHASQGQQRILALSLKVSELACVRSARGAHPILLLDDVSSELDPARTGAVYGFLRDTESQVFVTTTRPELFPSPGATKLERADFRLASGTLISE
jgi:DNA replication and repair protein RecF